MTDSTKKPEYREDDAWFSDAQLERLAPANHADRVHSPIPTVFVGSDPAGTSSITRSSAPPAQSADRTA